MLFEFEKDEGPYRTPAAPPELGWVARILGRFPAFRKQLGVLTLKNAFSKSPPAPTQNQRPTPPLHIKNREFEEEINVGRSVHPVILMEHFAHVASKAESEAEAEAFIGAMIPAAARLIPRIGSGIMNASPQLIRGLTTAADLLRRHSATRPLVRVLPTVLRRTVASLANQSDAGHAVTPRSVALNLALQMECVLRSQRLSAMALRRSQLAERQYGGSTWM